MSDWTSRAILAAASAWGVRGHPPEQMPENDYQLVAHPGQCEVFPAHVAWSQSTRPVSELISEIAAQARAWGHAQVHWWVSDATRPTGTEAALLDYGASLAETNQVLAYDMTGGLPALNVPPGARAEIVRDEPTLQASRLVSGEVWGGGHELSAADLARQLADIKDELASWSHFHVVVFLDGQPASYGSCTLADEVARLCGAATRPAFRGRGGYRAALARRLAVARQHGATLALAKGGAQTSAPILRRAGFTAHGEERCYCLDI